MSNFVVVIFEWNIVQNSIQIIQLEFNTKKKMFSLKIKWFKFMNGLNNNVKGHNWTLKDTRLEISRLDTILRLLNLKYS